MGVRWFLWCQHAIDGPGAKITGCFWNPCLWFANKNMRLPIVYPNKNIKKTSKCEDALRLLTGWWFQPIWNICSSKWVHLPQGLGWNKKYLSCHHPVKDGKHVDSSPSQLNHPSPPSAPPKLEYRNSHPFRLALGHALEIPWPISHTSMVSWRLKRRDPQLEIPQIAFNHSLKPMEQRRHHPTPGINSRNFPSKKMRWFFWLPCLPPNLS